MNDELVDAAAVPARPPVRRRPRVFGLGALIKDSTEHPGQVARIQAEGNERPRSFTEELYRAAGKQSIPIDIWEVGDFVCAQIARD